MSLWRLSLMLLLCLTLQAGLERLVPAVHDYLDLMLAPVVWCGIMRSQRAALLTGCASGLLHDAWFQSGVFGLAGFKKTLLGWVLGGVGARFDLNLTPGRFGAASLLTIADGMLDSILLRLVQQEYDPPGVGSLLIRAAATGVAITLAFPLLNRIGGYDPTAPGRR